MTVTSTSIAAYRKIEPKLGARQQEVLDELVVLGRASNQALSYSLRLSINQITPRVLELRNMGKVEFDSIERGQYGNLVKVWRPTKEKPVQLDIFNKEQECAE